jgi:uncharacterized protein (DUF1778 family)
MVDATIKYITIPFPRMTRNLYRGLLGDHTKTTVPISVRWTDSDKQYVDKQADVIGLSFSEFIRWCAVHAAKEVEKLDRIESFKLRKARVKPTVDLSEYE